MSVFSNSFKTSFQTVEGPYYNHLAEKENKCICPNAELLKAIGFSILPMRITAVSREGVCTATAAFVCVLSYCGPVRLHTTSVSPLGSDETSKSRWVTLHPAPAAPETSSLSVVELQQCLQGGLLLLSAPALKCLRLHTSVGMAETVSKLHPSHHFNRKPLHVCYLNHCIGMFLNESSNGIIYLCAMQFSEHS